MKKDIKFIIFAGVLTIIVIIGGLAVLSKNPEKLKMPPPVVNPEILLRTDASNVHPNIKGQNIIAGVAKPENTVTIVEFADFECPACSILHPELKKLLDTDGANIDYYYRTLSITPYSPTIATVGYAAAKQGKFREMQNILFSKQNEWRALPQADMEVQFEKYANEIGLDIKKWKTDRLDPVVKSTVEQDEKDALSMKINSTPTLIFKGPAGTDFVQGAVSYEQLKAVLDKVLTK